MDIGNYIRKCTVCAQMKPEQRAEEGLMGGHSKVERPWQDISMDVTGPLQGSARGNSFILVVVDLLLDLEHYEIGYFKLRVGLAVSNGVACGSYKLAFGLA